MTEGQGKTLRDVAIGESVTVRRLTGEGAIKRHIMDMGITKGTDGSVRKGAPLGDPIEAQGGAAGRSHRGHGARLRACAAQERGGEHFGFVGLTAGETTLRLSVALHLATLA